MTGLGRAVLVEVTTRPVHGVLRHVDQHVRVRLAGRGVTDPHLVIVGAGRV